MPDGTKIPAEFLTHDQFTKIFRTPLRVPMNVDASCGKRWPEVGPDQGVGDTQNQGLRMDTQTDGGCGVDTQGVGKKAYTEGVIIDSEASIDPQYFVGLDIGLGSDTTVRAEGHVDTDGLLVIDRYIQDKPQLGDVVRVPANQGL